MVEDRDVNGVRMVHFAASKNVVDEGTMFPHRNIHKYSDTSANEDNSFRNHIL